MSRPEESADAPPPEPGNQDGDDGAAGEDALGAELFEGALLEEDPGGGDARTEGTEPEEAPVEAAAADGPRESEPPLSEERTSLPSLDDEATDAPQDDFARAHLRGLLEALVFASDKPIKASELARAASAPLKEVKVLLAAIRESREGSGVQLDEQAAGFVFRTNPVYAPFVRDLTGQKPVKLTRAQMETLAILAYRQPITRPEIDDIRGVDSGPVLKMLLERDLVRILGKKDEPGRPLLYGTTQEFLDFFALKSLKDLPTLREFTELTDDSRKVVEKELGEVMPDAAPAEAPRPAAAETEGVADAEAPEARGLEADSEGESESATEDDGREQDEEP